MFSVQQKVSEIVKWSSPIFYLWRSLKRPFVSVALSLGLSYVFLGVIMNNLVLVIIIFMFYMAWDEFWWSNIVTENSYSWHYLGFDHCNNFRKQVSL